MRGEASLTPRTPVAILLEEQVQFLPHAPQTEGISMTQIHPDKDELYQRLLPIYREHSDLITPNPELGLLYDAFSKYWDRGNGSYSAGEAMQKALREAGIPTEDISSMQDAAQEYEDAMAGMEIMKDAWETL